MQQETATPRPPGRKWLWTAVVSACLLLVFVLPRMLSSGYPAAAPTASLPSAVRSVSVPPVSDPSASAVAPPAVRAGAPAAAPDMALIPGETCSIGSDMGIVYEGPAHEVRLSAFWLDVHEVTVRQFAAFVAATGFKTAAEEGGQAWVFAKEQRRWIERAGANWRKPDGRRAADLQSDLPVVQVTWSDAAAYARWAGKRLPTEAEWEVAARGGLSDADFPWGRELRPQGRYEANHWQGWFPDEDLGADGFSGPAPVKSFRANPYGLYDMAGNVWEWCADLYAADYYQYAPRDNPAGPPRGETRVVRGGSWLCAENSSQGLTVHGRDHHPPEAAYQNVGFRCARTAKAE